MNSIQEINQSLFSFFHAFAGKNDMFDNAIIFLADEFGYFLLFAIIVTILTHAATRQGLKEITSIALVGLFAFLLSWSLKELLQVPRPFEVLENVQTLFSFGGQDAFPSGHATFFGAISVATFLYHRRLGIIFILGAFLIGIARVIAGVHWPIDILAGFILGSLIGFIIYKIFSRF